MKKNLIKATIILVMLLLPLIPLSVNAATSGTCGDNLTWTLNENGTLTITGHGSMTDWFNQTGKPISPWCNNNDIQEILISDGVTSIGDYAFVACRNLKSVTISSSVKAIGDGAFSNCFNLPEINIPYGTTTIGNSAFWACYSLTEISIPESVVSILGWSFGDCRTLTSISIPKSVTYIGEATFLSCDLLTEINVDKYNSKYMSLDGVLFDKPQTTLISYPIGKKSSSYSIPNSVTKIYSYSFAHSKVLETIEIPFSITNIGTGAFLECYNLKDVYYNGHKKDWRGILINSSNTSLTSATLHSFDISLNIEKINSIFLVTPTNIQNGNVIIFTCYNADKMVYVTPYVYAGESTIPFTTSEKYDKIKVMIWECSETCVPLCEVEEVPLI